MYIVENTKAGMSLAVKFSENSHKPGAIIPLTSKEMAVMKRGGFQSLEVEKSPKLVAINPDTKYILFADKDTNIDDVLTCIDRLQLDMGIVRTG